MEAERADRVDQFDQVLEGQVLVGEGPRSASRTRSSSSAKSGPPEASTRSTSVRTKRPTSPSRAGSPRSETAAASTMSSPAPRSASSAARAAWTTVKVVVRLRCA
nr:hypothetical protein [Streptomyces griseus]